MTRDQFIAYLDDYNTGDPARLVAHYTPDVVFENYGNHQSGEAAIGFLTWLSSVVSSRMIPRHILIDGDTIALEADLDVTALTDLPDLPIGAMRKGERMVSRTFAFYTTAGPLIRHVRLAGWPPMSAGSGQPT